ncbi:LOW QUALITY PROTEIN: tripartite motif-containing protein 16-like [Notothenia coriiceps]|uniref:LOW QUALITY PROTEIN: tripartite motif-containing protein 16-like n=1 Tax=Notothenia coriiceps TaxID=8208 RepID=A0A6I9MVN5_9TELE|nr:PREDICTED: LOW QUALITY PROTEIN: tripartite motif-containing protein 16-like [Notothenia coriiceps]
MAQQVSLGRETLSCSICLDVLKDPVTRGHSYCMRCIKDCWGKENEEKTYSCPQCRQSFTPRPALVKSTRLAEFTEELKKVGLQDASPDLSIAKPGDVVCDFCSGVKLKAFKSCLMCMASFCEQHLQPHFDVAPLKKHKLVAASSKLQENICSRHDEVMKIFCRTDQQCICYLCSMDDHKGHDTVSAAAERADRQKELGVSREKVQQRAQDREKDVKALQQRVEAINRSADEAVRDSEKIFTEFIHLIEKRSSEVKKIRSQQKTQVSQAQDLEEKLQQEVTELRRKDAELLQLSHTEDHLHFLNNYPSLSRLSESEDLPSIDICPLRLFEDVTAAVSKTRDKLQGVVTEEWENISLAVTGVDVLMTQAEPRTRAEFRKYSRQITLDPNTAHRRLSLSDGNRKATLMKGDQSYSAHPDRFVDYFQVLSTEGLTGRCYWEVEWSGRAFIAVAYKNRTGKINQCRFGFKNKSWALDCISGGKYTFYSNIPTHVSGPQSSRIGVYLDHRAGSLSYSSVFETMTLLHREQTTFTQPLHPGFRLPGKDGDTVELCELK